MFSLLANTGTFTVIKISIMCKVSEDKKKQTKTTSFCLFVHISLSWLYFPDKNVEQDTSSLVCLGVVQLQQTCNTHLGVLYMFQFVCSLRA